MPGGTKEHAKLRSQSKEISEFLQLADIKVSLDEIHHKLDNIDKCRTEIQNLSQLVCQLKVQNEMKDKKIQAQNLSLRKGLSSLAHFLLWLLHSADLLLSLDFEFAYCYCLVAP